MEFQLKDLTNQNLIGISLFDPSKVKHWKPDNLSPEELLDGEIYHKSLYFDEYALNARNWHRDATKPLIDLAIDEIKSGAVIVDYGSGTGGSAIELVKRLDSLGLDFKLILVDPLESWFSNAYKLLKDRSNIFFCKSYGKDSDGLFSFIKLNKLLGGNKVDVILSSSTIHLIPANTLTSLFQEFYDSLSKNGKFIWSSGDIPSNDMPSLSHLIHDPYRELLKIIKNDAEYHEYELGYGENEVLKMKKKANKIFPYSNNIDFYLDSLSQSNMKGEVFTEMITKSIDECKLFMKTPRLSEIAGLISDMNERNKFIEKLLLSLTEKSPNPSLFRNGTSYSSYWHYGIFSKIQ